MIPDRSWNLAPKGNHDTDPFDGSGQKTRENESNYIIIYAETLNALAAAVNARYPEWKAQGGLEVIPKEDREKHINDNDEIWETVFAQALVRVAPRGTTPGLRAIRRYRARLAGGRCPG